MNTAFDPKDDKLKKDKNDNKHFPIREGQGDASSISGDEDSGISGSYPAKDVSDEQHQQQDEYDNISSEKKNKTP